MISFIVLMIASYLNLIKIKTFEIERVILVVLIGIFEILMEINLFK